MEVADDSFDGSDVGGAHILIHQSNDNSTNSLLSFEAAPDDFELHNIKRQKTSRDPMSHRIIEKRRRDRMNNCLADLSRLIPTSYLKQGQGRIEKTEIIEMAIKHIKTLQAQVDECHSQVYNNKPENKGADSGCCQQKFYQGFKECQDETLRYFVEGEAMVASDPFCRRVMDHLSSVSQQVIASTGDEKPELRLLDVDNQQLMVSSTLGCPSPALPLSQDTSILPLLPTTAAMLIPASPLDDKHLRNLLSSRALKQLENDKKKSGSPMNIKRSCPSDVPIVTCAPLDSSVAITPATCTSFAVNCCESVAEGVSSGYISDMSVTTSTADWATMSSRDSSVHNVYKFKHNITKRFSQERKAPARTYDGSSSASSREADEELMHHSSMRHKKNKYRHPSSSDSTPYPTSELSVTPSTSSPESGDRNLDKSRCKKMYGIGALADVPAAESCPRSVVPLPGFVLHPSGTHYIPISVSYSSIPDMFDFGMDHGPSVFHPISIPVYFRGPVISVPSSAMHAQQAVTTSNTDTTTSLTQRLQAKLAKLDKGM